MGSHKYHNLRHKNHISLKFYFKSIKQGKYSDEYFKGLTQYVWKQAEIKTDDSMYLRGSVRPKSIKEVQEAAKYASIIRQLPAPRDYPECSGVGVPASIVGWGKSLNEVHITRTASAAAPEMPMYAVYGCLPSAPPLPGEYMTDFFLVMRNKDSSKPDDVIGEVPWREDDSLYGPGEVKKNKDTGEVLWRRIGPSDITPLSDIDAVCYSGHGKTTLGKNTAD